MHHFRHADGSGVGESSFGKADCFEVYAVCFILRPLIFALQVLDHVVTVQCQLDAVVKIGCYQVVPYVKGNLCACGRGSSAVHHACFLHFALCAVVTVGVQACRK